MPFCPPLKPSIRPDRSRSVPAVLERAGANALFAADEFFAARISNPHNFRVLVVTDLLSQDVALEDVQYLAGHANPRTTQIYDRRGRRVTRNIVERISV